jgi:DNA-binding MarR family transcriptional regulator
MSIDEAIQQGKWDNAHHKAIVNIMYTSRFLEERAGAVVKPHGITLPQFNILRILRGQKGKPASVKLLTERMLDKSSNASRLVDKLLEKGLVQRATCPKDRRAVEVTITETGLELLETMAAWARENEPIPANLSEAEAGLLSDLLDKLREAMASNSPKI